MFRSAFVQFYCLVWPLLASGLVYECNFDGTRLNEQPQRNLSSSTSQLEFIKQLPPSRTVSHSCIVTTGQRESLLRVKAKAFGHLGEKSGKTEYFLSNVSNTWSKVESFSAPLKS